MGINRNGTGQTNLHIEQFKLDDLNNLPTQIKVKDIHGYSRWLTCTDVSADDIPTLQITRNGVYGFLGGRVEADITGWEIEPLTIKENNQVITPYLNVKYSPITVALPMQEVTTYVNNVEIVPVGDDTSGDAYQGLSKVTVSLPMQEVTVTTNNQVITPTGTDPEGHDYQGLSKVTVALPLEQPTYTKNGIYRPSEGYQGMSQVQVEVPTASGSVADISGLFQITTSQIAIYGPTNGYRINAAVKPEGSGTAPNPPVNIPYSTCGCSFKYLWSNPGRISANNDSIVIPWGYRTYFKQMTLSAYESAWTARTDANNAADIDMTGVSQADFLTLCNSYQGDFSFSHLDNNILNNWSDEALFPIDPGLGIVRLDISSLDTYRLFSGDEKLRVVILKLGYVSSTAGGLLHRLPNLEAVWLEGNPPSGTYPGSWFNQYDGYIWVQSGREQAWRNWFTMGGVITPPFLDKINEGIFSWYTIGS